MIIKKHSQPSIVFNYFFAQGNERTRYTTSNHIFYEGDILYSYGRHFPLAVRTVRGCWILNGDRYSSTTSGHQSLTRQVADDHRFFTTHKLTWPQIQEKAQELQGKNPAWSPNVMIDVLRHQHKSASCPICMTQREGHEPTRSAIIPFSTLTAAGIHPEHIVLLDVTSDTWEKIMRRNPKSGELEEHQLHHLGATVFRVGTKRFLSSIDTGSGRRNQYYLVELQSHRVNTVEGAFRNLARALTDDQYLAYQQGSILRQGEYYLEPHQELHMRIPQDARVDRGHLVTTQPRVKHYDLSQGHGNPHTATEAIQTRQGLFIRRTLRHPEHAMIRMGLIWHQVYRNTAVHSWSAQGRVD